MLDGGQCYALAAIGDGDVEDIDMRLLSITDSGVARRSRRHAQARRGGEGVPGSRGRLRARRPHVPRRGQLRGAELRPGRSRMRRAPPGIDGSTRIPYAGVARAARASAACARRRSCGACCSRRARRSIPLKVRAGRCYAVGAVATQRLCRRRSRHEPDRRVGALARRRHRTEPEPARVPLRGARRCVARGVAAGTRSAGPRASCSLIGDDAAVEPEAAPVSA